VHRGRPGHRAARGEGLTDRRVVAAVFAGGVAGALLRAGLAEGLPHDPGTWPWATFAANVAGALLLGWFATRLPPAGVRRPLLTTGFCGALTTFSTMQLELLEMIDGRDWALAAGYAGASVAAGLAAVLLATGLARRAA
jgi:CrcB protein